MAVLRCVLQQSCNLKHVSSEIVSHVSLRLRQAVWRQSRTPDLVLLSTYSGVDKKHKIDR